MGNVGPLAGKKKKAVDDQYKMKLGKGLPPKESYKTQVKPFRPAEDSLDEPRTDEEMDKTTQTKPKQAQGRLSGNSHGEMHSAMDKLEEKPAVRTKNQPSRRKLSMA